MAYNGLMQNVYMDNGATSWPKPDCLRDALDQHVSQIAANPGRAAHRASLDSARAIFTLREQLAGFFGLDDPMRVVFTSGVTHSLNIALFGLLRPGDRLVCSPLEHNAVMRPLYVLQQSGVQVEILPSDEHGRIDPADLASALRKPTRLVVINHASNVNGALQDLRSLGSLVRKARTGGDGYPLLLSDTAQSAGLIDIKMERDGIDLLAFTGHKGLLGPDGTGGLLIGPEVSTEELHPRCYGGTGSRSDSEIQPDFLPDRYEAGTLNTLGLAGLASSLSWIEDQGLPCLYERCSALRLRLYDALASLPGIRLFGPREGAAGLFSFLLAGMDSAEISYRLDDDYGVLVRGGLHCAPSAHRRIGSFPGGTVRLAPGPFTSDEEIERTIAAVRELSGESGR